MKYTSRWVFYISQSLCCSCYKDLSFGQMYGSSYEYAKNRDFVGVSLNNVSKLEMAILKGNTFSSMKK